MSSEAWAEYVACWFPLESPIPSAPEFYDTQVDPTILVQEYILPDLNGDGLGDIVAPTFSFGPSDSTMGQVGVVSGWFGDEQLLLDVSSDEAGDGFGIVAIGIPDIDGDLIDDLAIGAPTSNVGASSGGRVDVYSGATGAHILRVIGNETDGMLGLAIASAGDCNGDGINDLIIGEPHTDAMRGRAFVFYGAEALGASGLVTRSPEDADLSFTDSLAGSRFGLSVAGVGDLDGDGTPDLAVGSPNRSMVDPDTIDDGVIERLGSVTAFSGSTGERLFTVNGEVENSWFGRTLMGNVDVDGDGFVDLLIAAPGFPVEMEGAAPAAPSTDGRVFVLSSAVIAQLDSGATIGVSEISSQFVQPAGSHFQFGIQIAPSHDVDGDGALDILVSSMTPVQVEMAELPDGIDLGALGLPADMPIYTMEMQSHVYSGTTGELLYSYGEEGSGVEINIPYPGPVVSQQTSQATLLGDVTLDGVVDASDLAQTVTSVGQPAATSPTTDVNQDGVTEVVDVEIVNDIIVAQQAEADCFERVGNGEFADICECFEEMYPGIDPSGLGNPEELDCDDSDDPGPPGPGGGDGCEEEQALPEDPNDCGQYAKDLAECEASDAKAALDAEQEQINTDIANANATLSAARQAAVAAIRIASNRATTAANSVAEAATREMTNEFRASYVVSGASGLAGLGGGAKLLSRNPVTGTAIILIGSGFLVHIYISADNYSDAIRTINHQMSDTVFGGPDGFQQRPVIDNKFLDQGLWNTLTTAAQEWQTAVQTYRDDTLAARVAHDLTMEAIRERQEDLERRRQECEDAEQARKDELEQECIDELTGP